MNKLVASCLVQLSIHSCSFALCGCWLSGVRNGEHSRSGYVSILLLPLVYAMMGHANGIQDGDNSVAAS